MRAALAEAVHHARERKVFGETLIDQPLMARVLADMALDVGGGDGARVPPCGRLRQGRGRQRRGGLCAADDAGDQILGLQDRAGPLIGEAMECLGGNGYIEEGNLARHYREAPVNAIWEGSGNVMCLDVMRVIAKGGTRIEQRTRPASSAIWAGRRCQDGRGHSHCRGDGGRLIPDRRAS